jgi:peptide/nickel transport system substrate-binding protein
MRIIVSPEIQNTAVRTKELDLALGTPFSDYTALQEMLKVYPDMKWMEYHSNNWPRIVMATDKPPFNNKAVRQAMSISFDRKKHLDVVAGGRGWVDSTLAIAMPGAITPDKFPPDLAKLFQYNPAEAKRLIQSAGLNPPLKIKAVYSPAYGTVFVSAVEAWAAQLKAAGTFEVELVPQEYGAYISSTYLGKYEQDAIFDLTTPPVDPDDILWTMFHSTSPRNSARVKDPKVDELLVAQRREMDETKRADILKQLQLYLTDQMYYMPTSMAAGFDAWFPYVKGYSRHIVPWYNWGDRFRLVWLDK